METEAIFNKIIEDLLRMEQSYEAELDNATSDNRRLFLTGVLHGLQETEMLINNTLEECA